MPDRPFSIRALVRFLRELHAKVVDDDLLDGAAVLGFYLTLAIFPALIALMALLPYLPVADVDQVILGTLRRGLPADASALLQRVVREVMAEPRGGVLSLAFLGTVWAASSGMRAVMGQLNATRGVRETRSFLRLRATAVALSVLAGLLVVGAASLIVLGALLQQWMQERFALGAVVLAAFSVLRWLVVIGALLLAFGLVYRWGPATRRAFVWVSPGTVTGVLLLLLASLAFGAYVGHFGDYSATYGSIGAVIVLMLWLHIAGLSLLLGSAVDALLARPPVPDRD